MAAAPRFEPLREALGGARIGVAGGADLDRGGPGEQEFDRVFWGDDAAHAEDGDLHGAGGFIHHAQRDGLDGRAGEAAGDVGQTRTAGFRIDGHGEEGVDQADRVGAGVRPRPWPSARWR